MSTGYKRVLLKLSGEQLAGDLDGGIDQKLIVWIANEIKLATQAGVQVVVVVGAGNYIRGAQFSGNGIDRITGDYAGMLATLINGLAMSDMFNASGLPTRILTNIFAPQIADDFTQRRAHSHLNKNRVVIVGGGVGRPYFTTDTAAVSIALELDCDVIMKATKVDGVYDKDPAKFTDAQHIPQMTFQEAVENPDVKVMDKAALGLAMEQKKPIVVFDLLAEGNIAKVAQGEPIGTLIS